MKFFFDHDVPDDVAHVLRHWEHEVVLLRDALPRTSTDAEVFAHCCEQKLMLVTCNRDDFLELARQKREHSGLIILIRRRTHQGEAAHLLRLIENAGADGLRANVNFA